jgi:hypothetical protein
MSIMIIFNLSSAKSQQHLRMVFPGGHPTSLIGRECDEYVIEGSVVHLYKINTFCEVNIISN